MRILILLCLLNCTTVNAMEVLVNAKYTGFSNSDKNALQSGLEKIAKVMGTQDFMMKVLEHKFNGRFKFAGTEDSNAEVYWKIMAAKELLEEQIEDGEIDLNLHQYSRRSPFKTYLVNGRIYVNTRFLVKGNSINVASSVIHEWLHLLGYKHKFESSYERDRSVPYAAAKILLSLIK